MRYEQGIRVGAILSSDAESVQFLGWGTYLGNFVPEDGGVALFGELLMKFDIANPKILLDNGDVVWGFECWWGPEEKIRKMIGSRRVESVSINNFRV